MNPPSEHLFDHLAITQLLVGWGLWRDTCDWPRLHACYAEGAHMRTTWFDGSATDFIDASQRMAGSGKTSLQHYIGSPVVALQGDRALAISRVELHVRTMLDGVAVDAVCYGRFHDRLVKQDGAWRILRREPVYEKDRLQPVESQHQITLDPVALARLPAHFRYLAYLQSQGGATITMDLPAPLSPAERQLANSDDQWLQNGLGDDLCTRATSTTNTTKHAATS